MKKLLPMFIAIVSLFILNGCFGGGGSYNHSRPMRISRPRHVRTHRPARHVNRRRTVRPSVREMRRRQINRHNMNRMRARTARSQRQHRRNVQRRYVPRKPVHRRSRRRSSRRRHH